MKLILVDGYVDEPSAFGVLPVIRGCDAESRRHACGLPPVLRRWRAAIKAERLRRWTR